MPWGVNRGTLPAMTTRPKVRPRSTSETSATSKSMPGPRRRAVAIIDGSRSTPTTGIPLRDSSIATLPLPHPASSTEDGSSSSHDERSFAMHVCPGGGKVVEALLVGVAVPGGRPAHGSEGKRVSWGSSAATSGWYPGSRAIGVSR